MTLTEARATAADAIRALAPTDEVVRVIEIDVVDPRDVPHMADGLYAATDATTGDTGPAVVAVMVQNRGADQSIQLTAFTIMRDRPVIELTQTGRGRGLAVLDMVESALSNLPAHGLAPILVQSEVAPLPRHEAVQDFTIHVFITTAVWPSAAPDTPNTPDPGAMDAIRDHGADAVATALGLTDVGDDLSRRGDSEARRRSALIASLIPRGSVELAGGELAVSPAAWTDSSVTYDASGARQPVMLTVCIWHVDYPLADEAAALVAAELSESTVMWPGDYVVPVHLEALTPAVWDVSAGAAKAEVKARAHVMVPVSPRRQRVEATELRQARSFLIPPA